jgi:hypothetical protein
MLPFYEDETSAIHRHDPEAARAACVGRSNLMAQTMLAELVRRRVFSATDDVGHVAPPVPTGADAPDSEPSIAL